MKHQLAIQQLLQARMAEGKARNPAFSLRAFARRLELSPAMVSRVLSGQRQVSARLAKKIVKALMMDPQEQAQVLALFPPERGKPRRAVEADRLDPHYLRMTADYFKMISEWHYFAILSLFKTVEFDSDPRWIASRLGLDVSVVERALERLERLKIVRRHKDGRLTRSSVRYRTTDDVTNLSVRKAHFESLELARQSLESDPVDRRDFTSLTLAFPEKRLPEAKVMIRKFENEFDTVFEEGSERRDQVYRLCVSLFPLMQSIHPGTRSGRKNSSAPRALD